MSRVWRAHVPTILGKGRPRFSTKGGKPRAYTPQATRDYEAEVKALCRKARGDDPMRNEGCLLGVIVLDPIPESWMLTKGGEYTAKARRAFHQMEPAAARPDRDNILKAVTDGAQGAWFKSDAKVAPLIWRGWARSKGGAGVWLHCWEAETPAEQWRLEHAISGGWREARRMVLDEDYLATPLAKQATGHVPPRRG